MCLSQLCLNVPLSSVGSKGSVVSVEIREDHHKRAVLKYKRWRASWMQRRGEEWPDNVHFYNTDLQSASSLLAGRGFHSVRPGFLFKSCFMSFRNTCRAVYFCAILCSTMAL